MISIKNVTKKIDDTEILKNISLDIEKGTVFGLLGKNGAGKTSLLKALAGVWSVEEGEIKINNQDVYENINIKKGIGYVPDRYTDFSYYKVKRLKKMYNEVYDSFDKSCFDDLLEKFNIKPESTLRSLSKGMMMKLEIILALSIKPMLLLMDEPTSGLDPLAQKAFIEILMDDVNTRKTTVIISSHILSDIEKVCNSIGVIDNGEMIYTGNLDETKEKYKKLQVFFKDESQLSKLKEKVGILSEDISGKVYTFVSDSPIEKIEYLIEKTNCKVLGSIPVPMEDIFMYLTEGGKV
jgi:ABC-2 type transport system ATP-binding protein